MKKNITMGFKQIVLGGVSLLCMNCAGKKTVADSTNVIVSESVRDAKKEVASERELLEKAITRRSERERISSDLTLEEKKKVKLIVRKYDDLDQLNPLNQEMWKETQLINRELYLCKIKDKGRIACYLPILINESKTETGQFSCLSMIGNMGDERCLEPLKKLLRSKKVSLTSVSRAIAYSIIVQLGGSNEVNYLKEEYSEDKSYDERYILAANLSVYGDATGTPTLLFALQKNKNKEIRKTIREYLINIYSVDCGDNIEAWRKVIENHAK